MRILIIALTFMNVAQASLQIEPLVGNSAIVAQDTGDVSNTTSESLEIGWNGLSYGGKIGYKSSIVTYGVRYITSPEYEVDEVKSTFLTDDQKKLVKEALNLLDYSVIQYGPYIKIQSSDYWNVYFGFDLLEFKIEATDPNSNQSAEATGEFSNIYVGGGFNPFENLSLNLEIGILAPREDNESDASWATAMLSLSVPFTLF